MKTKQYIPTDPVLTTLLRLFLGKVTKHERLRVIL